MPDVTVQDASGAGEQPRLAARCVACGHDPVAAFRRRLAERADAWRAGRRVAQEVIDEIRLAAFADGWTQGLAAGLERAA